MHISYIFFVALDDLVTGQGSGLAAVLREFSAWDWIKVVGLTTASYFAISAMMGPLTAFVNVGITLASYVTAEYYTDGRRFAKESLQGEIQLGNTMAALSSAVYKGISLFGGVTKLLASAVILPAFFGAYTVLSKIIRKYSPWGFLTNIGGALREATTSNKNLGSVVRTGILWGMLPYAGILYLAPLYAQVALSSLYRPVMRYKIRQAEKKAELDDTSGRVAYLPDHLPQDDSLTVEHVFDQKAA